MFDKLVENGEAPSLDNDDADDQDKTNLKVLLPPEISEAFSFKENVSDEDMKTISAAIVRLQLGLGHHLRMKSNIYKSQLKVQPIFPLPLFDSKI